ncbi:lysophospholipid acyltransferase family protein [Candidatus Sumerlaeota bacterium]|nr:lysophospholipid acyltransferase family protein [Candidatus Sumerlaeota bacterium]
MTPRAQNGGLHPQPDSPLEKTRKKKKRRKHTPVWFRKIEAPVRAAESLFIRAAIGTLGRLSPRGRMRVARLLGAAAARIFPFRRKVVIEQLSLAFPQMTAKEMRGLLPEIYAHLFAFGLEMLAMARISKDELNEALELPLEKIGPLADWRANKQGFVLVTAHMGNWEWAGAYLTVNGVQVGGAAKPMRDPVGEKFIRAIRERFGVDATSTRLSPRQVTGHLIKIIKKGGTAALPADQDARHAGIFVDFFGRPAATFTGPAWLSYRLGVPLIPIWGARTAEGKLRYTADEAIWPDTSAEMESEVRRLTEYHVRSLEKAVRAQPAQYMWFHRRWKTKPKKGGKTMPTEPTGSNPSSK